MNTPCAQANYDPVISPHREGQLRINRLAILAAVVDADPDAIYFRDGEGVCRMANERLLRFLGLPARRVIGRCAAGLFPQETACVIMEQEEYVLANGAPLSCELTIRSKQGEIPCLVSHEALRNENREIMGVFGRVREISERKQLEREIVEISEREMRRIGADMHDDLCEELAAVSLIARLLQRKLADNDPTHEKIAGHIADLSKRLAASTRNLAHNLAPPGITGENFVEVLRRVATTICTSFPCRCGIEGAWPSRLTDRNVANHLYRIVHEAMYNAAKHSGGNYITVRLRPTQEAFTVYVSDNGRGFKPEVKHVHGVGLSTMRYRAGLIGGLLKIDSAPGRGTTVLCKVELGKKQ